MERWYFGEAPLPEVVALATVLRELTSTVLSLEQSSPELGELTEALRAANRTLAASAPSDLTPRIGDHAAAEQRVYVDHGYDVGAYNPCFPEYTLEVEGTGRAAPSSSRSRTRGRRGSCTAGSSRCSSTASSNS